MRDDRDKTAWTLATLDTLKDKLEKSFKENFIMSCEYSKSAMNILNFIKEVGNFEFHQLFQEKTDGHRLYDFASEVIKDIHSINHYFSHQDLLNFYSNFSEDCANCSEHLIDKERIDLSELDLLKVDLAKNLIKASLLDYQKDMDYFLQSLDTRNNGQSNYTKAADFINLLEDCALPFPLEFEYQNQDYDNVQWINPQSIKINDFCREDIKEYLKENPNFESDYTAVDEFLELESIKDELMQSKESQHRIRKHK